MSPLTSLSFHCLWQPLSAHQDKEGITAAVGLMDLFDLHCVICKEILDGDRPGVPVQGVTIVPQGKEIQHLTAKRLRARN